MKERVKQERLNPIMDALCPKDVSSVRARSFSGEGFGIPEKRRKAPSFMYGDIRRFGT